MELSQKKTANLHKALMISGNLSETSKHYLLHFFDFAGSGEVVVVVDVVVVVISDRFLRRPSYL